MSLADAEQLPIRVVASLALRESILGMHDVCSLSSFVIGFVTEGLELITTWPAGSGAHCHSILRAGTCGTSPSRRDPAEPAG